MTTTTSEALMAKRKPPGRNPASATVKIDPQLHEKAYQHCAMSRPRLKLSAYLDSILRGPIERDYARTMKRISKQQTEEVADEEE